ncbi:MAG: hypothetical protein L0196_00005, partial [candidate division Zixibacteria bacterium]|nr:hypothetical protein [candidate division Zixibacteria bacterium]
MPKAVKLGSVLAFVSLRVGLLLALPVLAWGQDPRDSIIIESKTVAAGLTGTPAFEVLVYTTNKDSLAYMVLNCTTRTVSGSGYALLNRTGTNLLTFGSVVRTLTPFGASFTAFSGVSYNDVSPDAFLVAGGSDGVDPGTNWPPNAYRTPVWAIKFRASSAAPGQMLINPNATVASQVSSYFTNTRAIDVPVNKVSGILTVQFAACDPLPYNEASIGAGETFCYGFISTNCSNYCSNFSLVSGPGSISPSGAYCVSGLCAGTYPVTIAADCGPAGTQTYSFTLKVTPVTPAVACPVNETIQGNQPYSAQASVSGGVPSHTFAKVAGPAGLSVSPTGAVSWTPSAADAGPAHSVTISVT